MLDNMYELISEGTNIPIGATIRKPIGANDYEYFLIRSYIPDVDGYEIKVEGVRTGRKVGLVPYVTKSAMISQNYEIKKE